MKKVRIQNVTSTFSAQQLPPDQIGLMWSYLQKGVEAAAEVAMSGFQEAMLWETTRKGGVSHVPHLWVERGLVSTGLIIQYAHKNLSPPHPPTFPPPNENHIWRRQFRL